MRLALLTNFIPPYRVPVLRELQRRAELRVYVSTPMERNREWSPEWQDLNVVVQRTLTAARPHRHPGGFVETSYVHIPVDTSLQLRDFRPDVVVSAEFGARTLGAARYAASARVPLVVWATLSERTEVARGPARSLVRRWLARRIAGVIVNGQSGARYIRTLGIPDDRILRIPQAADPAVLATGRVENHGAALRLLYVGQLVERKGLQQALDALPRSPARALRVDVVGEGPERQRLEEKARMLGSDIQVVFRGSLPPPELPEAYAHADVLLFPTLADEWGLVVNEALGSGVPVLGSSYAQAVDELVVDGVNGWRFRPDSAAEVSGALDRVILTSEDTMGRMREAARKSVSELTPACVAERLAEAATAAVRRSSMFEGRRT